MRPPIFRNSLLVPAVIGTLAAASLLGWLAHGPQQLQTIRAPGNDHAPGSELGSRGNAVLAGTLTRSAGKPGAGSGAWPNFRGPNHDGIAKTSVNLAHSASGLRELWGIDVGD